MCAKVDLPKSPLGFTSTVTTLCSTNVLCASSWSPQFVDFFFPVKKWNGLIMHDSWAPARRRERDWECVSVYARGCSESQSFSLGFTSVLCSCVCMYLCLMGRLTGKKNSQRHPVGYQQSADPDTSTSFPNIYLLFAFPCLFFSCYLPCSLRIFPIFFFLLLLFHLLSISWTFSLPAHSFPLLWLLCSLSLHIFPYLPITPPSSLLSLPPSLYGWAPVIGC